MFPLLVIPALSLALASPQQAATPAPAKAASLQTKTYHDQTLKVTLSYPANYEEQQVGDLMQKSADGQTAAAKTVMSCMSLPVVTVHTGENSMDLYMALKMDGKCLGTPMGAGAMPSIATSTLTNSLQKSGAAVIEGPPATVTIGGYSGSVQYGHAAVDATTTLHAAVLCLSVEGSALCVMQASSNADTLKSLEALPIQFDGQPAQPLFPPPAKP